MSHSHTADLSSAGVSIWLDDLSRRSLESGQLSRLVREHDVVGVTTNPTIFAAALADGDAYHDAIDQCVARGLSVTETIRDLTVADVTAACDVFADVYAASRGRDGRVSLEVDPGLAHDSQGTIEQARDLWQRIDRPNAMIKIPATEAGLEAITAVVSEGISVNVTLIFNVVRYRQVLHAYYAGIERARAAGRSIAGIHSVASVFVSRVDTEVDARLTSVGTDEALSLRGRAGIANARLTHEIFSNMMETERLKYLHARGAQPQRLLWASTGVKNAELLQDTAYVDELATPNTVNTMPLATLEAFADHGLPASDRVSPAYLEANQVWNALDALGIQYSDVMSQLEDEGLAKFEASWKELVKTVTLAMQVAQ